MTINRTHLTTEEIAAFLDRHLTTADREDLESHLAGCSRCRAEVTAVHRLVRRGPGSGQRRVLGMGVIAAAAAMAFLAFSLGRTDGADGRLRSTTAPIPGGVAERLTALRPADGDTVTAGRPLLMWAMSSGEPTYRITVTDVTGQRVFTDTTSDSSVTLPESILKPRQTYFWYVDALRADGRAASTGMRRFVVP